MHYYKLFIEFLKIGLFSFGGGYATVPFLYNISEIYKWYSIEELYQMLAIASITPGPIGLNMATYAGLKTDGMITAIIASISLVIPAIFICIFIAKLIKQFKENFYIKAIIYSLKPASCALIASVAIKLIQKSINTIPALIVSFILLIFLFSKKKSPLFYILISGLMGLIYGFAKA